MAAPFEISALLVSFVFKIYLWLLPAYQWCFFLGRLVLANIFQVFSGYKFCFPWSYPGWHHLISNSQWKLDCDCVPLSQSKSRFCDRKFDFSFHWRPNQSKIAIQTIYLRTWIVQIGISIWFEIGPLLCDQSFFRCSFRLVRKSNQSGLFKSKKRLAKRNATCRNKWFRVNWAKLSHTFHRNVHVVP